SIWIPRCNDLRPVHAKGPLRWAREEPRLIERNLELHVKRIRTTAAASMAVSTVHVQISPRPFIEALGGVVDVRERANRLRRGLGEDVQVLQRLQRLQLQLRVAEAVDRGGPRRVAKN